jgi:hypothetical protein
MALMARAGGAADVPVIVRLGTKPPAASYPPIVAPGEVMTVHVAGIASPADPSKISVEYRIFPKYLINAPQPLLPEREISLPILAVDQASDRCYPASPAGNCVTTSIRVQLPYFEPDGVSLSRDWRRDVVVAFDGWRSQPRWVLPVFIVPAVERRIDTADSGSFSDFAWNGRPVFDGADAFGRLRSGQRAAFFARGLGRTKQPAPLGGPPDGPERIRPTAGMVLRYTWLTEGTTRGRAGVSAPKSGIIQPDIYLTSGPPPGASDATGLHRVEFTVPPMPADSAACNAVNRFYNLILILAPDPAANILSFPDAYRSDIAEACVESATGPQP